MRDGYNVTTYNLSGGQTGNFYCDDLRGAMDIGTVIAGKLNTESREKANKVLENGGIDDTQFFVGESGQFILGRAKLADR